MSKPRGQKKRADDLDAAELTKTIRRLAQEVAIEQDALVLRSVLTALINLAEAEEGDGLAGKAVCAYLCAREALYATFQKYLEEAAVLEVGNEE